MSQVCQVPSFAESLIIDLVHTMDPDITCEKRNIAGLLS